MYGMSLHRLKVGSEAQAEDALSMFVEASLPANWDMHFGDRGFLTK